MYANPIDIAEPKYVPKKPSHSPKVACLAKKQYIKVGMIIITNAKAVIIFQFCFNYFHLSNHYTKREYIVIEKKYFGMMIFS